MSDATISVIVPVYNRERTLRRCVDSIVCQTYADLEIILVDNGSEDKSRAICDEYASKDSRVRVIHKENGGVSSSRNAGLAAATGQWIGWVDSDDWIEPDMYEYLMNNTLVNEAEISICGWFEHTGDMVDDRGAEQLACLDTEQALASLLADVTVKNHLWNKLWKTELFHGVRFPERRYYEDISTVYRLFEKAERTILLPEKKYHYMYSPSGLIEDRSLAADLDYSAAVRDRFEELSPSWPQFAETMKRQCAAAAVQIWCSFLQNDKETRRAYMPQVRQVAAFSKGHLQGAMASFGLGLAGRTAVWLTSHATWCAFVCARVCNCLYGLKHGQEL